MNELLRAESLWKSYQAGGQRVDVLQGLDLTVPVGDIVAIIGESGSGKSTLLHLLGGMDRPDKGCVRFSGQDIYASSSTELASFRNREVGFVFQFHHLLPEFTALENIGIPPLIQHQPRELAMKTAYSLLQEVGLEQRAHHRPAQLSGGEQQRVALARALATQPRLLLADEPTGNLDRKTACAIEELLMEIHKRRKLTIILVTHSDRLARCCRRILRLENGVLLP
jgi:lipoprotein-releasing system ATP-binding protein